MGIYSFNPFGFEGSIINIEVDLRRGIPATDIVGLSDGCVAETRERVRAAIKNQNLEFPSERVLIALSPCDLKKEGAGFDLPLALAILEKQYGIELKDKLFCMGELELSGNVRNIKAVNAGLQNAGSSCIEFAIIPHTDNLVIPKGMKVATVDTLAEAYNVMWEFAHGDYSDFMESDSEENTEFKVEFNDVNEDESLDKITEHNGLKFAMAVAVAGKHHVLAYGEPGCGKTMVLQRMTQLMPKLTAEEKQTVNRIYSVAGLDGLLKDNSRPFRMPHQTASIEGTCGGGATCRPGEISLAHNGVLFLDEAAEFKTSVLQMLRVPLESHQISLSRAGRMTVYPANFLLVMTANPCPCGNYGSKTKICLCSAKSVEQYWKKFSAPLLDRISIRFNVMEDNTYPPYSLKELRGLIKNAWERQHARQGKLNNELDPSEIDRYIILDKYAKEHFESYSMKNDLSPRAKANLLKLARTIQDMHSTDEKVNDISLCAALNLYGKLPFPVC